MTDTLTILAIDPGPVMSAWVLLHDGAVYASAIDANDDVLDRVRNADDFEHLRIQAVACEWIECYGMAVGKDVFETVHWIGRFAEAAANYGMLHRVTRRQVKLNLCNSARAKDANVRQALIDRFPATGGGKCPQIGTKACKGPLYGCRSHIWSALAVGVVFQDQLTKEPTNAP